jgi:hypothetical protein
MVMQRFSELVGCSLRDAAAEIVIIDSSEGYNHFRPLFENGDDTYCRSVFITDGDEIPDDEMPSDADFAADSTSELDTGLEASGSTATSTGYGTFEFGLLRSSIIDGGNEPMQALLTAAMEEAAPSTVRDASKQALFAQDFLDFERPSLAYKKMKEGREGRYVQESDWHGSWRTNSYFKKAKSDFAFHLNELLGTDETARTFTVPKYIADAIRFVTETRADDSKESTDASDA